MYPVDVVDPASESLRLILFSASSAGNPLQQTHLLFWDLCKSLEIMGLRGVGGVEMLQKFLTIPTFGTPLRRSMCLLLLVGTALEPPNIGLSNAHLIVFVAFFAHDIFERKCNALDQQNIEEFHLPK